MTEPKAIVATAMPLSAIPVAPETVEVALAEIGKIAQQALNEQSRLSEIAGVGTWTFTPATDVLESSPAWANVLAQAGVEPIASGEEFRRVCHPEDAASAREALQTTTEGGAPGAFTYRVKARSGRWISIRCHIYAEPLPNGRKVLLGISQNITELVEARDAALASEHRSELARNEAEALAKRLKVALHAANAAVVEINYDAGTVWMSPQFVEVVGWTLTFQEARQPAWPFVHPDDRAIVEAGVKSSLAGAAPEPVEVRIRQLDGTERWIRICTEIQKSDTGRWRRTISLILDIDERKRQELALIAAEQAAQAATETKSRFLANMSHEIRTPLNGVLGMAQAMEADPLPELQRARLTVIRESGDALLEILNDILDLSKIEAGRLELEAVEYDLEALVRNTCASFAATAEEKGLTFNVINDGAIGCYRGDPTRVRQVLSNLISNAIKFTDCGEVRVTVQPSEMGFALTVRDSGAGIEPEALARIFSKFTQADASTTRKHGGTGLGLSISRDLVEMMGGEITVDSQLGVGSTFRASVPAECIERAPAVQVQDDKRDILPSTDVRILVAEDNAVNQLVIKTLLMQAGIAPTIVANGSEAVEAWQAEDWSVILMDVQMPVMDGARATARIRQLERETGRNRTPIVGLSANAMPHQTRDYIAAGMDACVAKPIEVRALLDALEAALAQEGVSVVRALNT
ncbi:MAG: ATP-binding protein [Hyphomonadaceae bacterium]|nr:ATP-binding protein [Hyphomonadaceae bacterium]